MAKKLDWRQEILGLSQTEALAVLNYRWWHLHVKAIRATTVDGTAQFVTSDHSWNRLNVAVEDGAIVAIEGFG